jgi:hypothetical protein
MVTAFMRFLHFGQRVVSMASSVAAQCSQKSILRRNKSSIGELISRRQIAGVDFLHSTSRDQMSDIFDVERKTPSAAEREARKLFREAEAVKAMTEHERAQKAFFENRDRLRALRLAREAQRSAAK